MRESLPCSTIGIMVALVLLLIITAYTKLMTGAKDARSFAASKAHYRFFLMSQLSTVFQKTGYGSFL